MSDFKQQATQAKKEVLKLIFDKQVSHLGSNFSCIDFLTVLFSKLDLSKDEIIFSKGWVAASAYYFLSKKGILNWEEVKIKYCDGKSEYVGLVEPYVNGIKCAGGSMGYGLCFGVGFALQKKMDNHGGRVYVLMSDGELDCGTNWEAVNIARKYKLDNLTAIVDMNGYQAMSKTEEVLDIKPKYLFSNWEVNECNGHDFNSIESSLNFFKKNKPKVIIANTIKGAFKNKSDNIWHYKAPNKKEYNQILKELNV